jgi:Ca2+-transporting ATPase
VLPHKWLVLAILWEVLLIAVLVQLPSLRQAFGIVKPSAGDLAMILGFGAFLFASMEVLKGLLRRRIDQRAGGQPVS